MSFTLSHPYEKLSVRTLRVATIGTLSAWGVLTLILLWAVPVADIAQLRRLLEVAEPGSRREIMESWDPSIAVSLSFLLGFDFLYDLIHNNAAALFAVWGGVRRDTRVARSIGDMTVWVLWLDSGLNVFENLAFLHILRSGSPERLLTAVSAIFSFRSTTLVLGFLVGAALHTSAWRASRLASRRSGPA